MTELTPCDMCKVVVSACTLSCQVKLGLNFHIICTVLVLASREGSSKPYDVRNVINNWPKYIKISAVIYWYSKTLKIRTLKIRTSVFRNTRYFELN